MSEKHFCAFKNGIKERKESLDNGQSPHSSSGTLAWSAKAHHSNISLGCVEGVSTLVSASHCTSVLPCPQPCSLRCSSCRHSCKGGPAPAFSD